ncbi:DUF4197 family protein, partial [Klebsiella variicola]|uniref:DUF4197 family protein n=1 Tax=Klebsiella variicola TaxID=244366 RepID=UPI002730FDCC
MQRRHAIACIPALLLRPAAALNLTEADANAGIRAALERGAQAAVALLGRPDGFLGNPLVKIELPGHLRDVAKL